MQTSPEIPLDLYRVASANLIGDAWHFRSFKAFSPWLPEVNMLPKLQFPRAVLQTCSYGNELLCVKWRGTSQVK
jgi:hypothetical protein